MHFVEIILIWIHLMAATFWVGGMLFLSLVAVPLLKKSPDPASAQREFVNLARRFRLLVWIAFLFLLVSGSLLLSNMVDLSQSIRFWPPVILTKLSLVFLLIVISLAHDQFIGPKIRMLKRKSLSEMTKTENIFLWLSPLIGRLTMVIGLAILLTAVVMVRG